MLFDHCPVHSLIIVSLCRCLPKIKLEKIKYIFLSIRTQPVLFKIITDANDNETFFHDTNNNKFEVRA